LIGAGALIYKERSSDRAVVAEFLSGGGRINAQQSSTPWSVWKAIIVCTDGSAIHLESPKSLVMSNTLNPVITIPTGCNAVVKMQLSADKGWNNSLDQSWATNHKTAQHLHQWNFADHGSS
jgi:hypothetical protein